VIPDAITYNALISACEKGKLAEQGLQLFHSMSRRGVVADMVTFSALIDVCHKRTQPDRALELL